MRKIEEIKMATGMSIKAEGEDGFTGVVHPVEYKNGKTKIINKPGENLVFIFSWGGDWEHLSVSTQIKTPTWEQMQKMKEIFWGDDEVCMQLHPKKEDYVDNMPFCLHIWKPLKHKIPTPPSVMVGFRKGKEKEDKKMIKKLTKEEK